MQYLELKFQQQRKITIQIQTQILCDIYVNSTPFLQTDVK